LSKDQQGHNNVLMQWIGYKYQSEKEKVAFWPLIHVHNLI